MKEKLFLEFKNLLFGDDKFMIELFADFLELIYICITFCWDSLNQQQPMYYYSKFEYALKPLMYFYKLFFKDKKKSKKNDDEEALKELDTISGFVR